jgi:hypothetical protein
MNKEANNENNHSDFKTADFYLHFHPGKLPSAASQNHLT